MFKKIFIINIKLRFLGKDWEECQSVALEWIKKKTLCTKHNQALIQEDFHCKHQIKVSKKELGRALIYNSTTNQEDENKMYRVWLNFVQENFHYKHQIGVLGKGLRKMPICSSGIAQEEQNNSHYPHD